MSFRVVIKVIAVIVLLCLAILLYAELAFYHQIHPISDALINSSPDEKTRLARLAERDRRNREERTHKAIVGGILVLDVALCLYLAAGLVRRPKRSPEAEGEPSSR